MNMPISNPQDIADAGERIYSEKYKEEFEKKHSGKFVAIDVITEEAYIAEQPEEALDAARKASPKGYFHLIKVGSPGAFRVGYISNNARSERLFRSTRKSVS